ncbi:1-phosphofructokinase family hexose kinase [Oceanispirochaeta sp.]|jgi:1-phosphofructokinase|uniref:1-phosphofructokinase family hexose kinase n=1 Tax=Oceanispirochaeta sp. TaxID=2035350 RepID=UPI002626AB3F|nr:1-phosphofructokinase family hexose kinase [Oceanispirochaeta sp.]MDA3958208.1 1-phosphofructokinase family hexose kinase [Oceanispirochaeta sp.]
MKKILTVTLNPAIDYTIEVSDFSIDSVNRASAGRRDPGGKGINAATALSQGGFETHVCGFLGNDNKQIFCDHFKVHALEDHFHTVDGSTREGIKIVDPKNSITTDINFNGFTLTEGEIGSFMSRFRELVKGFDYVIISGSLPSGLSTRVYADMALDARNAGAFVAVDTSGQALKYAIESGCVDLIKPNLEELSEIFIEVQDGEDKVHEVDLLSETLLEKVGMIALSLGKGGSRLYTRKGRYQASAPPVNVKSTVGGGDTFLAGFIGGLASGQDLPGALRQAASWAASKLTIYGPGLSKEDAWGKFMDQIVVTEF